MPDIMTLLKSANPVAATPGYSQEQRAAMLARASARPAPRRRRIGLRIATVAAATLTVIGIGTGTIVAPPTSARAAEILQQAAINAIDPVAGPTQYWEITVTDSAGSPTCPETGIERYYRSVSGDQPSLDWSEDTSPSCNGRSFEEPRTRATIWSRSPNELTDNWSWPSPKFLDSLPRESDRLRERMVEDSKGLADTRDLGVYLLAVDVLESGIAPADLRSAVFEVLSSVPAITVVDESTLNGRPVVTFTIKGNSHEQLMIDPSIGQIVGFRNDVASDNIREAFYERRLVDQIPPGIRSIAQVRDCTIDPTRRAELGRDGQLSC